MTIVCQTALLDKDEHVPGSDIFYVVNRLEIVLEVPVLLRADVWPRPHRLPTHRAAWSARGNHRFRFSAQISRLLPRHAAGKRRVGVLLAIEIVRDDHDAVLVVIVAQLHAADPKLLACLPVEFGKSWCSWKHRASVRQAR